MLCLWYMFTTNRQKMRQLGLELSFWELLCKIVAVGAIDPFGSWSKTGQRKDNFYPIFALLN